MILGLGSDIVDIRRIERLIARFGDRFLDRIFTEIEQNYSDICANRVASYARRFVAKEACAKALGTGFRDSVLCRDFGVVNLSSGKPVIALTGGAARKLSMMTPTGMKANINLSITDEPPMAYAVVLISALPIHQ